MKTKTCSKCKIEKDVNDFHKNKTRKDGLNPQCKDCKKSYHLIHKKEILKYQKNYRKINKQKSADYRQRNNQKVKEYNKQYRASHKEELKIKAIKYQEKNKKKIKIYMKAYRTKYKSVLKEYKRDYDYRRKKEDVNFRIRHNISNRILKALKRNSKSLPTMYLIGCDTEYLMYYIQEQFTKGMNWDNHGRGWYGKKEWHIDHIKPCYLFDLSKPSEQRKCFHYTNLQPLWSGDNMKKGNKYKEN